MSAADREALYVSRPSGRNLWQEYRIFSDRIELPARILFHTLVVSVENIAEVEIRPKGVFWDVFRGKTLGYALPLKIDSSDAFRHVALRRSAGWPEHIRFTPDDPDAFVRVLRGVLADLP